MPPYLLVGNPSIFAIRSQISKAYARLSYRALGYFTIIINGNIYGVQEPDATMLACSLQSVEQRLAQRGRHIGSFSGHVDPISVSNIIIQSTYARYPTLDAISVKQFHEEIIDADLLWAPDGDEAFDDGSYVAQFDIGDKVRLIGFKQDEEGTGVCDPTSVSEALISPDQYYDVLDDWRKKFLHRWAVLPKLTEEAE